MTHVSRSARRVVVAAVLIAAGSATPVSAQQPYTEFAPPQLTCQTATETTITLRVCGGIPPQGADVIQVPGAPAGFLIEWSPPPPGFVPPPGLPDNACFASFNVVAADPDTFSLDGGECVDVVVAVPSPPPAGDDPRSPREKWEAGCVADLQCSTEHTFIVRPFRLGDVAGGHGASVTCTTAACQFTGEGCTPGYWKNHLTAWSGYGTSQLVGDVFAGVCGQLANKTLLQALSFKGGNTICAAQQILLRAAAASLLNSVNAGVNFPRDGAQIIADVNAAVASNNRDTILSLAAALDADNNLGCPLN